METKPIKEMNRMELIFELAKYVRSTSPTPYHEMITWKTEHIRALIEWYNRPEEVLYYPRYQDLMKFMHNLGVRIEVDFAKDGEEESIIYQWPFGYTTKIKKTKKKQ